MLVSATLDHHCSSLLFFSLSPRLLVSLSCLCWSRLRSTPTALSLLTSLVPVPERSRRAVPRPIFRRPSSLLQASLVPSSASLVPVPERSRRAVPRPIFRRPSSLLERPSSRSLSARPERSRREAEGPSLVPPSMVHTDKSASHPVSVSRSG
ncbi:hypothetical protein SDC9_46598 [bioreactor metagenome]|uniref:Uncharacterized protein n=1 Tax=bioreactor metagenome TaxID=1076179 RepID=A0A644WDG1_9ZZZZ